MARELSKLPMFAIFLTLDHTACFFLLSLVCNNFFPGSGALFMLGALPVIIDLGGTKPLGGICIYLGGTSDPQGNHGMNFTTLLFLRQLGKRS